MNISFTGHKKLEVTDSLRQLCTKKFRTLEKHIDNIQNVAITFTVEHLSQIAEATVSSPGFTMHATAESDDMYKSIDDLLAKLLRQATKHKEKNKEHKGEKKMREKMDSTLNN